MRPKFFKTPDEFRAWLEANHDSSRELWVGYHKKATGRKSITWEQAVDVALCFGWIDGVNMPVDENRRRQRFTPRLPKSNWSKRNIERVAELEKAGLMHPSGVAAFERRVDSAYSYEQRRTAVLPPSFVKRFKANKKAWSFFEKQTSSYRRAAIHWVTSAKQEATRERRLAELIETSKKGEKPKPFNIGTKR